MLKGTCNVKASVVFLFEFFLIQLVVYFIYHV